VDIRKQAQKFVSMTTELYPRDRPSPIWSLGARLRVIQADSVEELLVDLPNQSQLNYVERGFFATLSPLHHSIRYSTWRRLASETYSARDSGKSPEADALACVLIICALGLLGGDGKEGDKQAGVVGFPESRDSREEMSKKWLASAMQALLMG
jgi:hypothetical protein